MHNLICNISTVVIGCLWYIQFSILQDHCSCTSKQLLNSQAHGNKKCQSAIEHAVPNDQMNVCMNSTKGHRDDKGPEKMKNAETEDIPLIKKNEPVTHSAKLKVRTDKCMITLSAIVVLFLITHCYRLTLKMYEVFMPHGQTAERFQMCANLGRYA